MGTKEQNEWALKHFAIMDETAQGVVKELYKVRTMTGPLLQLKMDELFSPLGMPRWAEWAIREVAAYLPEEWTN